MADFPPAPYQFLLPSTSDPRHLPTTTQLSTMNLSVSASLFTPVSSSTLTTTSNTRSTSYAMNPDYLVSRLVRDANLDYDILCEQNCNGQNVNVKCSSGFYLAIAKPTLSSISEGHSLSVQGIIATLSSSTTDTIDINGLVENRLLKISLKTATVPTCSLGTLSIHLRHSTRLVQIQASFMMPDSTMAPVWFVENVLLPMFKERGNVSSKHIQGINNAILALNTIPNQDKPLSDAPSTKSCGGCLKLFKGKACPVPCTTCAKFFHKTTCWKSHQCGGISSTSSPPSITSTISPVTFSSLQPLAFSAHQPITFSSSQPPSRTLPVKRTAANITCFEIDSDDDEELSPPTVSTKQPTVTLHPDLLGFIPFSSNISTPCTLHLAARKLHILLPDGLHVSLAVTPIPSNNTRSNTSNICSRPFFLPSSLPDSSNNLPASCFPATS